MCNYLLCSNGPELFPLDATKSLCLSVVHRHPVLVENVDGQQLGDDALFENMNNLLGVLSVPSKLGPLKLDGSDITGLFEVVCPIIVYKLLSLINGTLLGE